MSANISRRSLLKASGVAAAGAALASVAGTAFADEAESSEADAYEWEGEYDVIVVGAGLAGLVSAITVADAGDGSTCLLLEKGTGPSGNTPYSEGRMLITNDTEAMTAYLKAMVNGETPDDVVDAFVEGMTGIEDWLLDHGADESWLNIKGMGTAEAFADDRKPEFPELEGSYSVGVVQLQVNDEGEGYSHVMLFAQDLVEQNSDVITYLTETPCEDLIQDSSTKEILGVVANGKNYRATKGVIMCLGGFEKNMSMLKEYTNPNGAYNFGGEGNTGDGFPMVQRVGAKLWHMNGVTGFYNHMRSLDNTKFLGTNSLKTKQYGITVGVNGRRYYQDWDAIASYAQEDEDGYDYLTDRSVHIGWRHGMTQFGGEWSVMNMPPTSWFIFDSANLLNAIPESYTADPVADGYAVSADTIEELADAMGVPSDELVATVELWNQYCADGKDLSFYRAESSLVPIAEPPYYAVVCAPAFLNTYGGPAHDANNQVLDIDDNPIPHLYAAGEFGSFWAHWYQGCGCIGECVICGQIAAKAALAN